MLVSIITPVYNAALWIPQTYSSLCNQTHKNWEWLVTDDCSSDDSYDFLCKIAEKDKRVKVFQNKINSGAAISRNNSLVRAMGDFIGFIDCDDLWFPKKIETQISAMEAKALNFSFTGYQLIDTNGRSLRVHVDSNHFYPLSYEDMLRKKATIGCSTVMLRTMAFEDILMPNIRTGQDYALWLSLLKKGELAYPINDILTSYRIVPGSISRNKFHKAKRQWMIYREIEKLTITKSLICFCWYAWRAIFRK